MCFYVTALGFSMMATVMTVNPLGNDLSSCLHSSCTAPPCPGGHAAVASISPASSSECQKWRVTECVCVLKSGCCEQQWTYCTVPLLHCCVAPLQCFCLHWSLLDRWQHLFCPNWPFKEQQIQFLILMFWCNDSKEQLIKEIPNFGNNFIEGLSI